MGTTKLVTAAPPVRVIRHFQRSGLCTMYIVYIVQCAYNVHIFVTRSYRNQYTNKNIPTTLKNGIYLNCIELGQKDHDISQCPSN